MEKQRITKTLNQYKAKKITLAEALMQLRDMPFEDIGFAKIDHHRVLRNGFPEVIYCKGKNMQQITDIFTHLRAKAPNILLTKASPEVFEEIQKIDKRATYNALACCVSLQLKKKKARGKVLIIAAGTADIPVAEEAAVTAEFMGVKTETVYDVGVAGLPRLLASKNKIFTAKCIIAIAGMDGACVPVTAGLANCPVIAVPTSTGYGSNLDGFAPLLTMLNSCAPGVAVMNIDNGFGAGYMASLIIHQSK